MKPFFCSLALHEAHHLKNLLESAGIRCRLKNEGLSALAGEIPFSECAVQLFLLSENDRPEADTVLRAWRAGAPSGPHVDMPRVRRTAGASVHDLLALRPRPGLTDG